MSTQTEVPEAEPSGEPASVPSAEAPVATVGGGKNIVMPSTAFKNRLSAATERGKRAALSEFEVQAKQAGFSGVSEMFTAIAKLRQQPAAPAPTTTREPRSEAMPRNTDGEGRNGNHARSARNDQRDQRRIEHDRQRLESERKARIRAERLRREADRARQDAEVRQSMREAAMMAGVSDVDYGTFLLDQYVSGKTPEDLAKFDEKKWFEDLRTQRPYLFGEVVRPATTGTGPGNPPAPKPGAAINGSAAGAQVDARKMNGVEFRNYLAKKGLSLDDAGQ